MVRCKVVRCSEPDKSASRPVPRIAADENQLPSMKTRNRGRRASRSPRENRTRQNPAVALTPQTRSRGRVRGPEAPGPPRRPRRGHMRSRRSTALCHPVARPRLRYAFQQRALCSFRHEAPRRVSRSMKTRHRHAARSFRPSRSPRNNDTTYARHALAQQRAERARDPRPETRIRRCARRSGITSAPPRGYFSLALT